MQVYSKDITVTKDDLDQLNHVNNVRYVQWVQDIAEAHWQQNATPEILNNYFWVLLSHHIEYKSQARLDDVVRITTFVETSHGVTSTRRVEMYHKKTNQLIVTSLTKWCLISSKTEKPARITEAITALFD